MHETLTIPSTGGPFAVVTTVVPATHVPLVTQAIQTALDTPVDIDTARVNEFRPPHGRQYGPKDPWTLREWVEGEDDAAMRWAISLFDERQRRLLGILVGLDGEFISTGDLLPRAGYADGTSASGVFRALAGACRANARKPFWDGAPGAGSGRLIRISPDRPAVKRMLIEALAEFDV